MMKQDDLVNFFNRALKPLKDRVLLMIGRAIISAVKDSTKIQELQIQALAGESMEQVQRFQEFGYTSNPPPGTEAIIVGLGGNRANLISIATEHRDYRKKNLASGETMIYTDDGTIIHLKKAGQVEVLAATRVLITCPLVEMSGNLLVHGNTVIEGTLLVEDEAHFLKNVEVDELVGAGGYTGIPLAGTGQQVNIDVPVVLTANAPLTSAADISTTTDINSGQDITADGNVFGGATDMADIKSTYNTHTHPENNIGSTDAPNQTL